MPDSILKPDILPPAQRRLWDTGLGVPRHFVLYGGTALALRLGHRQSVDCDFFSAGDFLPGARPGQFLTHAKAQAYVFPVNPRCSFGEAVLGQRASAGPCFFQGRRA